MLSKKNDQNYKQPMINALPCWRTPKLLDRFNYESKVKTTEGCEVGVHSLTCSTLGVEGHAGALGWGLGWMTSDSIIHTDLHKPNNKLVSA
jgi:hypothetical protein